MAIPQAYPLGYVEDVAKVRTPLVSVFSSRLTVARLRRKFESPVGEQILG